VVDIVHVRLVANIIEKDLKQIGVGDSARVEVDAFPGESFMGRIARLSPVLDPATRTAPIEIEIPNDQYRLKPGMYARVGIITESHATRWWCRPTRWSTPMAREACTSRSTTSRRSIR